ncbi:MAG: hypothetical protein QXQ57_07215 [Sulfolobales archaeon]
MRLMIRLYIYVAAGLTLLSLSIMFFIWSIGYMEHAFIATALLSALVGFSLLSASLYVLRLSAYVYGVEQRDEEGRES